MFSSLITRLDAALRQVLAREAMDMAVAAKQLSLSFTSEREQLPADYIDKPQALAAYAAAFLLPNAVKVAHALVQADRLGILPKANDLSVLDIGAGPCTATLASALSLQALRPNAAVRFTALDRSGPALALGKALALEVGIAPEQFSTHIAMMSPHTFEAQLQGKRFDLIVAANVVNELPSTDKALAMVAALVTNHLAHNGVLLLIDPALRDSTRLLMTLRDQLLADGLVSVHAPCVHEAACPMLREGERDWCHFYIEWQRSSLIEELDRLALLDRHLLKMSYFLMTHASNQPRTWAEGCARVVSSPLVSKGKREVWLCSVDGALTKVRRIDRDASPTNAGFDAAVRGDVIEGACVERFRSDDAFQIIAPWPRTDNTDKQ